ncbi:type 4a pilus biogenesis protein PilO [Desulfuromonas sp.]|uniref:type 4a pilus biogenesis protein PilO n=1 Tax=Desulfuromonas sp. TaxID=892 RepID=UPI0025B9FEE4|nr:type 4a pilus biogenesis protein PilO [Desulfuromonas sp.]
MMALLEKVPQRTVYGVLAAIVVLLLLASWLYLFKKPLAEYARVHKVRTLLEAKVESGAELEGELAALAAEVQGLNVRLLGERPPLTVSELVAHTVARLDQIAARHGIRLVSLKPGKNRRVPMLEELPFHIKVEGEYFGLYECLYEVERELGPMVIKNFSVKPLSGKDSLSMELKMVSYRPAVEEG